MFMQPVGEHRYFFAVVPPLRLARQVTNAMPWLDAGGRSPQPARLHITMFILPDFQSVPNGAEDILCAMGDAVAAAPVPVTLDMISASTRSIALRPRHRIAELAALRRELTFQAAVAKIAERPGYNFSAHMTLGYRDGTPFSQPVEPIAWIADEFVLVHSHLGKTRHDVVARWPLRAPVDPQLSLL
jgi:2'-5' RNA ligase